MVKLSFCIPTYNRVEHLKKLVQEILSCDDPDIEVVVTDNCSTDNTLAYLATIDDKRLHVYSNKINQGSLLNTFNVLGKATGKYIYFSTDKDFINSSNIITFKIFLLENDNISCGYCEYFPKSNATNQIFKKGFEAVSNMGYLGSHPSGYFFNKEMLESTNYLLRFSNKDLVGEFASDFIFAELALMGNVAVFNKELTIPQTNNDAAKDKSLSINGNSSDAFFAPASRLKMAINHTKHINQLQLSVDEKKKLMLKVFISGLFSSTFGYKAVLKDIAICEHYHIKPRNVGIFENIVTAWNFYEKYYDGAELIETKNRLNKFIFGFDLAKIIFSKITNKLVRLFMRFINGK